MIEGEPAWKRTSKRVYTCEHARLTDYVEIRLVLCHGCADQYGASHGAPASEPGSAGEATPSREDAEEPGGSRQRDVGEEAEGQRESR